MKVRSGLSEPRLCVFISGRGSTLQALLEVPVLPLRLVVSSRKSAQGLLKARRAGVETMHFASSQDWEVLDSELRSRRITHIFLCGFMRIIPAEFVQRWSRRIFNVHPSLLPLFPGAHGIEESLQKGGPFGVSLHEATEKMDAGPLLMQGRIHSQFVLGETLSADERLADLQMRISQTEQRLLRQWSYKFYEGVAL